MKRVVVLVALLAALPVRAVTPEVQTLIDQFTGKVAAPQRDPAALRAALTQVLEALVIDFASDDPAVKGAAEPPWEAIGIRCSRPGAEPERLAFCEVSLTKLGPEVPTWSRVWILKQLQMVARGEVVARLVELMADPDPYVAQHALLALQNNPSDEATAAVRAALAAATEPLRQIALVNAVGFRKDAGSTAAVAGLLGAANLDVARAAADCLGTLGTPAAAEALTRARGAAAPELVRRIDDALLRCADALIRAGMKPAAAAIFRAQWGTDRPPQVRLAALRGVGLAEGEAAVPFILEVLGAGDPVFSAMAARLVTEIPGEAVTRAFAAKLPDLPAGLQVVLLGGLAERGDGAAREAVMPLCNHADDNVATAAVTALATLGNASSVPGLAAMVAGERAALRAPARAALTKLKGDGVDNAIVAAMNGASSSTRLALVDILADRRAASVTGALTALAQTATDGRVLRSLMRALVLIAPEAERPAVRGLLKTALESGDPAKQRAAIAGYAEWPDGEPAAELLATARAAEDETVRDEALRGYLRMYHLTEHPAAERVAHYRELLGTAKSDAEKAAVLEPLGEVATPEALALALEHLPLGAAGQAAVFVGRELAASRRDEVRAAMTRVKNEAADGGVQGQAGAVLEMIDKLGAFITDWRFAGPFRRGNADNTALFDQVFPPEEKPDEAKWEQVEWRVDPAEPWRINLDQSPWNGNNRCCYARTRVFVPAAMEATFELGSDDGVKVWVNGAVVHQNNVSRGHGTASDSFKVQLVQGWNTVMVKLTQGGGQWALSLRVLSADGKVIEGFRSQAEEG